MKLPRELLEAISQRDNFDIHPGADARRMELERQAAGVTDELRNGVSLERASELGQLLSGLLAAAEQRPRYYPERVEELNRRRYAAAVAVSNAATKFHASEMAPTWEKFRRQYEVLVDLLDEVGRHRAELAEEVRGIVSDNLEDETRRGLVDVALLLGLQPRRMGPVERERDRQHREGILARKAASKVVEPPMSAALARQHINENRAALAEFGKERDRYVERVNDLARHERVTPSLERRRELAAMRGGLASVKASIEQSERTIRQLEQTEAGARKREDAAMKAKAEAAKAVAR